MEPVRISKRLVDSLKARAREFVQWDADLPGFGVRVRPTGHMVYVVQYRAGAGRNAPSRKATLGAVGKLTPEEARTAAKRMLGAVSQGTDPVGERKRRREALTVAELAEAFLAEHVHAKRKVTTSALYRHLLDNFVVPALGTKRGAEIARTDVAKLHQKLRDRPYLANRMLAVVASMYVWAGRHGHVEEGFNPAARIEKFPESRRERFLNVEELERLGAASARPRRTASRGTRTPARRSRSMLRSLKTGLLLSARSQRRRFVSFSLPAPGSGNPQSSMGARRP